jgi:hypothetical protein
VGIVGGGHCEGMGILSGGRDCEGGGHFEAGGIVRG